MVGDVTIRRPVRRVGTGAGRPVQQHALDVPDAQPLDDGRREHARRERAPEDGLELRVQAANAQALKVDLLVLEELRRGAAALPLDREARACAGAGSSQAGRAASLLAQCARVCARWGELPRGLRVCSHRAGLQLWLRSQQTPRTAAE